MRALLSLLILFSLLIVPGGSAQADEYMIAVYNGSEIGHFQAYPTLHGQTFVAAAGGAVTEVALFLKSHSSAPCTTANISIGSWDGSEFANRVVLASEILDVSALSNSVGVRTAWHPKGVWLTAGANYWLGIDAVQPDTSILLQEDWTGAYSQGAAFGTTLSGVPASAYDIHFQVFGSFETSASVTTQAATYETMNTVILGGMVTALGGSSLGTVGFDWGLDPTYGATATVGDVTGVGLAGYFTKLLTGQPVGVEYHYRAWLIADNTTYYGADLTFLFEDALNLPTATLTVDRNNVFGVILKGVVNFGAHGPGDIQLEIDDNVLFSSPTSAASFADLDDIQQLTLTLTDLTPAQNYYPRLTVDGTGADAVSNTVTFWVHDPSKPPFINWFEGLFGSWGLGAMAWWLAALMMVLGGLILAVMLRKGWPLIVLTLAAMIMLIVVDTSNIWIVVLLGLIAGLLGVYRLSGGRHA